MLLFLFGKKRVNAWWWILCAGKLLDCAILTAGSGGKLQGLFLIIRRIMKKIIFFPVWQVHLYLFDWKACKNIHILTGSRPSYLFVFQEEMWGVGWKEFLNNMKCWSGTGHRLPCISGSLLVPLYRAHGKSATGLQVRLGHFLLAKCLWIKISTLIYISHWRVKVKLRGSWQKTMKFNRRFLFLKEIA